MGINSRSNTIENIKHGNAIVCGTETAWILPGGRIIRNEQQARMYAIRMDQIMRGEA